MNKLSKRIGLLTTLLSVFWATGCSDFLDESDPSNFTVENYFTQPAHGRSSVSAIYAPMRDPLGSGFGGGPWMMTEFATGLAGTDLGQAVNSYFVKDLRNTSDNGYGQTYWGSYYRGIANANLSIAKVPTIPAMDAAEVKKLLGEAYFLRAFYYFNLVRLFGNIPLVTEPVNLDSEQLKPSASSPEDVYNLIVADLKLAEESGLPWTDATGKVSLGAVKSLLSQVYLTMAGYPLQKGATHYALAAAKAAEVIDSKQFKLFTTYADLHNPAKKNVEENIFMIQFRTQLLPSNWQVSIIPYNKNISQYSDETGGIYSTGDFVKSYDAADLRIQEKQFFYTKFTNETDRNKEVDLGGYFIYKHFDNVAQTSTANSDLNWPVIRYADVLLTYAEAANEATGPSAKVLESVNAIRTRAQLPALAGLAKDKLREAIWKERWHELCFENITWFDMVRLRKAFNVKTKTFENYVGHKFSYGPTVTERELLFPIPTSEIRNNTSLRQNNGY
ncbi:RagB/SusD family nutrient uptake outer membrane protein [Dyadobacter fanqingshengii]|uniref:RagB/SusD family nutrient uptake outer membrane protein n=1 Tax=Dyadobacter fanqingshengii TaxID=2906443 RepID=A0A9X1P7T7_9BACT|nr:RagB/SusD family nutrient uptake outer membrane protein [Dyadobacter fanqingshengii]MCF0039209.1 RagB/SusD family nutrient uptake outer membrane protein [Dyadobacter fanqingshengii]MCF2503250.1 RagB/SusD family nutrient uptake outer membrane protein [Dyadobacter fanqingshengii]USJ33972.1 RagB/SusD family nutrient uptake outer membrane protein [Dyadobacter fanqingshengii]